MIKNISPEGYKKIGVYTPAKKIDCGNYYLLYVSGIQAHASQENNSRVDSDDIEIQTHQVFSDIGDILNSAGATFDDVIKAVIYVTDMSEFEKISRIRADYFKNSMPVSTLVEVSRMVRDGAKIEIEVTAIIKK
ncbi:MAG: RidA family protein [Clostridia bacterium]|nr:RidA family protein [Clostridia bacterium]